MTQPTLFAGPTKACFKLPGAGLWELNPVFVTKVFDNHEDACQYALGIAEDLECDRVLWYWEGHEDNPTVVYP